MTPTARSLSPNESRPRVVARWLCACLVAVLAAALSAPAIAAGSSEPTARVTDQSTKTATSARALPDRDLPRSDHDDFFGVRGDIDGALRGHRSVGEETLWIFDADFEDLLGDNAGWMSLDMSGTLEQTNYWHKDTIRINGFEHLGDSTWWCGTYNDCWVQSRGYGNGWVCILERSFPEVAAFTDPGDDVVLEYDQRYAIELSYDYGYTDISIDGGETWATILAVDNPGFAGSPGMSQDWDSIHPDDGGHVALDLSEYAGQLVSLRFRFESDLAYSSQDQYNNPPLNSVKDGAWQLDNFEWTVNGATFWYDDCESPGSNGWVHDNIPASGQAGVVFERVFDPDMLRPWCGWPREHWWMAALDPLSGTTVDGQNAWLISPPIDISGATSLVGQWEAWYDCPRESEVVVDLALAASDDAECVRELDQFVDFWFYAYDGPYWYTGTDDWSNFAGPDWFAINWGLRNYYPGSNHRTGFIIDRQRVGVPVGGPPTTWYYDLWNRFHDTFDIAEALTDTAVIRISDGDGIDEAYVVVSSDAGASWESSQLERESPESDYWWVPPPVDHIAPSTEIRYYFESTDGVGNVRTHPRNAPDAYYEFSILPINGSISEPCILLVDKHGRTTLDSDRVARHTSEYFYREALDILGFEYDVFDVNVPSGSILSDGPDSSGMKYYDTQIWFTNEFDAYTIRESDQRNLIAWLSQSAEGKERNLVLTGNDIGYELIEVGRETLGFYTDWLATEYVQNRPGDWSDTMCIVRDVAGDFAFMTHDGGRCHLWDDG